MADALSALRRQFGVILYDLPRYVPRLVQHGRWVEICNRREDLLRAPDGPGVRAAREWTASLHACTVFPLLGRWLMRNALADWPIRLSRGGRYDDEPQLSFVVPFRGAERLPQLRLVVASLLAQDGVATECIVVEQAPAAAATGLPPGVRHIHLPHPSDAVGWRKSWAINVGVDAARSGIVVCHDADVVAPSGYAREVYRRLTVDGYEAAHLEHLLFRLGRRGTERLLATGSVRGVTPEEVTYNWPGGTFAVRRDAFCRIGGFDEAFVGWGGEDNEFRDRCSLLHRYDYGYLPFLHLWHPPQETKLGDGRAANMAMLRAKLAAPAQARASALRGRSAALITREPGQMAAWSSLEN